MYEVFKLLYCFTLVKHIEAGVAPANAVEASTTRQVSRIRSMSIFVLMINSRILKDFFSYGL